MSYVWAETYVGGEVMLNSVGGYTHYQFFRFMLKHPEISLNIICDFTRPSMVFTMFRYPKHKTVVIDFSELEKYPLNVDSFVFEQLENAYKEMVESENKEEK